MPAASRARSAGFASAAGVPVYLTALVGREREIEEAFELLRVSRLVSLVGAGGSGKTRLAAAVAESIRGGPRIAVGWIDLTALSDPALVAGHTANILGLREHAGGTALDALVELLGRGPALLVFDNCEHLLGACARLVDTLLRGSASLRILATSRQALGVSGERLWPVPPLTLPDPDRALAAECGSVQLFVQRARDALPGFALTEANAAAVVHICRRLDGLPLAIELAAARVRLLPPEQLASRLDSMLSLLSSSSQVILPRHRTLRALIDWSYALLSPEERLLMERLAVFVGGFTLEAAEAVASDGALVAGQVLDLLAGLVDKSLVSVSEHQGEARYALLETVRQYAQERLGMGDGVGALRERHAGHFLGLAEAAEPHVLGGIRGTPWMTRLEQEHGNLRAAMKWCDERDERAAMELRFGAALHWFDFALGQFEEPRHRLESALARGAGAPPRLRGRALAALGYLAFWTGDHGAVHAPLAAAVELLRTDGSPTDLAFALAGLATMVGLAGDADSACRLFDEAEGALGDPAHFAPDDFPRALLYAFARYWRGAVAQMHGDLDLARASYETSIRVARRFGSHPTIAHPLAALARTLTLQGDLDAAQACLGESVPLHVANDDRWGLVQAVEVGALLMARRERMESAARLLGAADQIRAQVGAVLAPHERPERERLVEMIRARAAADAVAGALAEGAELPVERILHEIIGAPEESATRPAEFSPGAPVVATPQGTADLRVRALGPLQLFLGERPLEGDAFGSSKPRELLLFLLCHPAGCTREQVGLAFWPEASAAQVKNSFHVTLHRLRKALEHPDWIVSAGDRYRLDPDLVVDFDAERFEAELQPLVREALANPGTKERMRTALALYGGDFLDGEVVGDWHLDLRDRLRRLYVEGMLAVGRFEMGAGNFPGGVEAFRSVLARDRLNEEAGYLLMVCHARTGARTDALRLYESLRTLLREELGVEPNGATVALYDELRSGREPAEPRPLHAS